MFKKIQIIAQRKLFFIILSLFCHSLCAKNLTGLPELVIPADNLQTQQKIDLGRLLFNDQRFSADGTISCASCHQQLKAYTDGLPVAKGINGQLGVRNAPTVINTAYYTSFFHDGRAESLEKQALGPLVNPIEHGLTDHQLLVDIVRSDPTYIKHFKAVFGTNANEIQIDHVVKAIASFERSLVEGDSAFDRYFFGADKTALSDSAARGVRIFRRKGNCANCHEISWNNALFTDSRFYNIGVGFKYLQPALDDWLVAFKRGEQSASNLLTVRQQSELGRFNVTQQIKDIGKFKTPSLRNIALTGPYMHDGSMQTLAEVIEYYDQGGEKNRFLDAAIFPLELTDQEKRDLLAFLMALTSPGTEKSKN